MSRRLDAIARDLAEQLERESEPRLRRVALAALGEVSLEGDGIDRAVEALREARCGETSERAALKALVDELDEAAWGLQDDVKAAMEAAYEAEAATDDRLLRREIAAA